MDAKNSLLLVLAAVLVAGVVGLGIFRGSPEPVVPGNSTSTAPRTETLTHSYLAGYEGVNYRVTMQFDYPSPQFTTMKDELAVSQYMLHEGDRVHWFYVMMNDGAGFTSPDQAFEENWKERLCATCVKAANPFPAETIRNATALGTYENADVKVLVWGYDNDFYVAARLMKPSEAAEAVIRTFRLSFPRTDELLPYQQ